MRAGDDDTVFFMPALDKVLQPFNHSMPYLLSDAAWNALDVGGGRSWAAAFPSRTFPRCLPCHFNTSGIDLDSLPIRANVGCPCTPELACSKTQAPTRGSWTHEECLAQKHRCALPG
jgi:hypothetical protein